MQVEAERDEIIERIAALDVGCVKDLGQVLGLITLRRSLQLGSR